MRYADGTDLVSRYDARVIADLLRDDNTSASIGDVFTNSRVLAALDDACGQVEAALLAGERYSIADLEGLTGNSQSLLKRIVCDIAISHLLDRRASRNPEKATAAAELAEKHLTRLRKGEIVFNLAPQQDAGLPESPQMTQLDRQRNNGLRDRVKNYFPARRYPTV